MAIQSPHSGHPPSKPFRITPPQCHLHGSVVCVLVVVMSTNGWRMVLLCAPMLITLASGMLLNTISSKCMLHATVVRLMVIPKRQGGIKCPPNPSVGSLEPCVPVRNQSSNWRPTVRHERGRQQRSLMKKRPTSAPIIPLALWSFLFSMPSLAAYHLSQSIWTEISHTL
jgi:hypothetical protein